MSNSDLVTTTGRFYRDVYVVGDVHGAFDGLVEILRHAGLVDGDLRWAGKRAHLIQSGDVVDRGPDPERCLELLFKLRRQARTAGGRVDLLVGNHELALAQGEYAYSDHPDPVSLGAQLSRAIRAGVLQAARAYRQYLMTHAGVCVPLMSRLLGEVRREPQGRVTISGLSRHLNRLLKRAFERNDFSHPMFHIGKARGGQHAQGGIFWADYDFEHDLVARQPRVWQVFGHSPPTCTTAPFRVSPDAQRVNIDVGICGHYGGHRAYVRLCPDRVVGVHCRNEEPRMEVLSMMPTLSTAGLD